jgi:predicted nucleic acid-binding Zn ribbon protein
LKFRFGEERKTRLVSFSNLVSDLINDLEIKDSFIIEELKSKWSSYVGNILSTHSFPERIFNKNLFINVDHSVYAGELSIHTGEILKKIKRDFGENFIKAVKFEVKKSRWRKS